MRRRRSQIAADPLATVAKSRLGGRVAEADLRASEDAIRVRLGLPGGSGLPG